MMKAKMTFGGIGPRLALITLPYAILCTCVIIRYGDFLRINFLPFQLQTFAGYSLLLAGILFYVSTIYVFLSDFTKGKLVTRGPFRWCRNPIYGSFIVFFLPALSLLLHSGLVLSIDLVLYINFRMAIHGEYAALKTTFGEEYLQYERTVNEILPIPRFRRNK
jgi:protein-S-isoprenylcysteine O-methyltransferase Ste14